MTSLKFSSIPLHCSIWKMCNFVIPVKYRATLSTKTLDFSPEKIFNRLHGAERDARLLQQPTRRVGSLDAAFFLSTFLGAHPANKTLENQHLEPQKRWMVKRWCSGFQLDEFYLQNIHFQECNLKNGCCTTNCWLKPGSSSKGCLVPLAP